MTSDTKEELHPLLVTELADQTQCEILHQAAAHRAIVVVPLQTAPVDLRVHRLDVYVPGESAPVSFIAEPAGPPDHDGFPLRLAPFGAATSHDEDNEPTINRAVVRPLHGHTTSPTMSKSHTRDLDRDRGPATVEDTHTGRLLGGGKYRLDNIVGSGGMGVVYRGHHRDLDKIVAVKVLHRRFQTVEGFSKRFHAEALAMSRIDHPNVTRVLDFGEEPDGVLYIVMEFLDGVGLETLVDRDGPLPLDRLVRIMTQVTAALGQVHRHGIIHRDVKPNNIVIVAGQDELEDVPTEIAKVCDFSIAQTVGEGGRVAGTPAYMSPEQCRGLELDARSDVYACGVILYELATRRRPFVGPPGQVMLQQMTNPPRPPSSIVADLDPLLEAIILKALAKDPAERQPSMRHLRTELRELLAPVLVVDQERASVPPPPDARPAGTSTMPRRVSSGEKWLGEEGIEFVPLGGLVERDTTYDEGLELAETLARDPTMWLSELAATIDEERFGERAKTLQLAVKRLVKQVNVDALVPIVATLRRVIKEEREPTNPRVKWSGRVLRTMRDPQLLVPIVDRALSAPEEPSRALVHILVETQAAGADALVVGRSRHHGTVARTRFVTLVRAIGIGALPVLRLALESVVAMGERSGPMVEDLLRAMPPVPDESTGTLVAALLRNAPPATTAAALVALASSWGERARPLLLGALGVPENVVRLAALSGLRAQHAIDGVVLRQFEPILSGAIPASDELRVAAAAAIADVRPETRPDAASALARALTRATSRTGPPTSAPVAVALAKALLAIGGPSAAAMVQERAASASDVVGRQLQSLLRG